MNLYMRNKMTGLLLTVIQILGVIKYNHCSCLFKMLTHYVNLIVKSYSAISPGPSSRNIDGSCLLGRIAMLKIQQLQKLCLDLHLSPQPTPDKFHHPFFFLGFIFPELFFHPWNKVQSYYRMWPQQALSQFPIEVILTPYSYTCCGVCP